MELSGAKHNPDEKIGFLDDNAREVWCRTVHLYRVLFNDCQGHSGVPGDSRTGHDASSTSSQPPGQWTQPSLNCLPVLFCCQRLKVSPDLAGEEEGKSRVLWTHEI